MSSSSYVGALGAGPGHDFSDCYVFPASPAQARLWFLCELEPESNAAYNVISAVRLRGTLNRLALQRAVDTVVARHESLRTGVALVDGEPQQVVLPSALVAVPLIDCRSLDEAARRRKPTETMREEAARPFPLHRPPLVRMVLLRTADDEHVLVVTVHHLVCDGWSMELFFRDLATSYVGLVAGGPGDLPELPIQYADYAVWQKGELAEGKLADLLGHWRERLAGVPPLDLPTDRPRPPVRTLRGALGTAHLPQDLVDRLSQTGQERGATLYMTLLTAFKALLAAYSGQEDIAVGTPVAGREHPDAEQLIGFFANTLVLRTIITPGATFGQALEAVRTTCLDAFSHQDVPFDRLVEELRPPRDLSRTPLFQVMFALQNTPGVTLDLPELQLEPVEAGHASAKFDLWLSCVPDGRGLRLRLEYNADLFDEATIRHLLDRYRTLLEHVTEDLDRPLSWIISDGTDRQSPAASASTLAGPGEHMAEALHAALRADPSAEAVTAPGGTTLTRDEVHRRANRLAHRLRAAGATPGKLVAVRLPSGTADAAIAVAAVIFSGSALLPVDPRPGHRTGHVLTDCTPQVVLTTADRAADHTGATVVVTDRPDDPDAWPDTPPDLPPDPAELACVVHSFEAAARPRGVRIGHRALAASLREALCHLPLGPGDRVSVSLDDAGLGAWGVLLALLSGARIVHGPGADPTVLVTTAADWRHRLRTDTAPTAAEARVLVLGEALPQARPGLCRLHGGAEALGHAIEYDATGARPRLAPAAHLGGYLLDPYLRPVADGIVGELYVTGPGLAEGYHGRPDDTAGAFLPDPLSGAPGARMYRTGDLCRRTTDGAWEFVGRRPEELKAGDRWVAPAEIVAVLEDHPLVSRAAVITGEFGEDTKLVAWLERRDAPGEGDAVTDAELTRQLREEAARQLPAHMVPAVFGLARPLPIRPDGSVDRQALAARKDQAVFGATDSTPPRNPTETRTVALFRELLPVQDIGVHANFFGLGGHSMLAARLIGRVRKEFGVQVPVRDFFKRPTPAGLAGAVSAAQAAREGRRGPSASAGALADIAGISDDEVARLLKQHLQ